MHVDILVCLAIIFRSSEHVGATVNPPPPGLLAHPWVPGGGGGGLITPLLYREPLVAESQARRHSKALDKTLQNHLNEPRLRSYICEVKVRSKVKIRRFDVWGPGDQDYRTCWLERRQNVVKSMVNLRPAGGCLNTSLRFFADSKKTAARSAAGFSPTLYIPHLFGNFCECFNPGSCKVRSPGQVKWP